MSLPVVVDPDARVEFDEACDYDERRRGGLGESFADAVQAVLDRIGESPLMHPVVFGDVRRAVVRGFPCCVYYRSEPTRARVLSGFHSKRDPRICQSRA